MYSNVNAKQGNGNVTRTGNEGPKFNNQDIRQMETTAMRSPPKERGAIATFFARIGTAFQKAFFPTPEQKFEKAQQALDRHVAALGERLADYRVSDGGTNAVFGIIRNLQRMADNGPPHFNKFIAMHDSFATLPDSVTGKMKRFSEERWTNLIKDLADHGSQRVSDYNDRRQAIHAVNPNVDAPPPPRNEEATETAKQIRAVLNEFRSTFEVRR